MRFFSLFSGVGGFEIGIKMAYENQGLECERAPDGSVPGRCETVVGSGMDSELPRSSGDFGTDSASPTCVGFSEIDKHASAVLRYRFGELIFECDCGNLPSCPLAPVQSVKDIQAISTMAFLRGARNVINEVEKNDTLPTHKSSETQLRDGKNGTLKKANQSTENILLDIAGKSSMPTETSASAVEKVKKSSSPSTTKTTMETSTGENTERDTHTSLLLGAASLIRISSSAITVTMQKGGTKYVHTKKYRQGVPNFGDISKIDWSTVPDFDLLVGGSPCQDFSIAGKRAGLVGARSGLAYEFVRALEEKRPAHFIWENVKGVLSSNRGWDFAAILNQMAEAGYSLWWQVLNAKDFGVPQNRERVFVVGARNGCPRKVFFENGTNETNLEGIGKTLRAHTGGISGMDNFARTIRVGGAKSPHKSKQNWDSYEVEGKIRRLTSIECERLMSWPDNWTKYGVWKEPEYVKREISDTQRYKMCGNGVVSKVVAEIVRAHLVDPPPTARQPKTT